MNRIQVNYLTLTNSGGILKSRQLFWWWPSGSKIICYKNKRWAAVWVQLFFCVNWKRKYFFFKKKIYSVVKATPLNKHQSKLNLSWLFLLPVSFCNSTIFHAKIYHMFVFFLLFSFWYCSIELWKPKIICNLTGSNCIWITSSPMYMYGCEM